MALAENCELIVVNDDQILYAGDAEPTDTIAKYHLSMARGMKPEKPLKIRNFSTTPGCTFNARADKHFSRQSGQAFDTYQQCLPVKTHFPTRPKF